MGYKPIDYSAASNMYGSSLRHAEQQGYAAEYLEAQLVALHSKLNEVIDRLNGLFASSTAADLPHDIDPGIYKEAR